MASRQLVKAEMAHAERMADTAKAAEIAERFPGWKVFSSRDGKTRVATRTGDQRAVDDGVWAATLIAYDWDDRANASQSPHCDHPRWDTQCTQCGTKK
jgi:hypothetical protein